MKNSKNDFDYKKSLTIKKEFKQAKNEDLRGLNGLIRYIKKPLDKVTSTQHRKAIEKINAYIVELNKKGGKTVSLSNINIKNIKAHASILDMNICKRDEINPRKYAKDENDDYIILDNRRLFSDEIIFKTLAKLAK